MKNKKSNQHAGIKWYRRGGIESRDCVLFFVHPPMLKGRAFPLDKATALLRKAIFPRSLFNGHRVDCLARCHNSITALRSAAAVRAVQATGDNPMTWVWLFAHVIDNGDMSWDKSNVYTSITSTVAIGSVGTIWNTCFPCSLAYVINVNYDKLLTPYCTNKLLSLCTEPKSKCSKRWKVRNQRGIHLKQVVERIFEWG